MWWCLNSASFSQPKGCDGGCSDYCFDYERAPLILSQRDKSYVWDGISCLYGPLDSKKSNSHSFYFFIPLPVLPLYLKIKLGRVTGSFFHHPGPAIVPISHYSTRPRLSRWKNVVICAGHVSISRKLEPINGRLSNLVNISGITNFNQKHGAK